MHPFRIFIKNMRFFQITADGEQHTLTIPEVFSDDMGVYQARAINPAGEAKCYAQLTVQQITRYLYVGYVRTGAVWVTPGPSKQSKFIELHPFH